MNRTHNFSRQECSEYEPILSTNLLMKDYEPDDGIQEEEINCDSCIYFNSFECKIFK